MASKERSPNVPKPRKAIPVTASHDPQETHRNYAQVLLTFQ